MPLCPFFTTSQISRAMRCLLALLLVALTQLTAANSTTPVLEGGMPSFNTSGDYTFASDIAADQHYMVVGNLGRTSAPAEMYESQYALSDRYPWWRPGSVLVYRRTLAADGTGTWTLTQRLTRAEAGFGSRSPDYDEFGQRVALKNGWLAVISKLGISLFREVNGNFVHHSHLTSTAVETAFSDGALIGIGSDAIECFRFDGIAWQRTTKIDLSGNSVVGTGGGLAITSHSRDSLCFYDVYRIGRDGSIFLENSVPGPTGNVGQDRPAAIAVSGNRFVVGAPGRVHVFVKNSQGTWDLEQSLTVGNVNRIAIEADRFAISARPSSSLDSSSGGTPTWSFTGSSSFVYQYTAGSSNPWTQLAQINLVTQVSGRMVGGAVAFGPGYLAVGGGISDNTARYRTDPDTNVGRGLVGVYRLTGSVTAGPAILTASFNGGDIPLGATLNVGGDIGSVAMGESQYRAFVLNNHGGSTLTFDGSPIVRLTGPGADAFTVVEQPTANILPPGIQTAFTIRANPVALGVQEAYATVTWNGTSSIIALRVSGIPGTRSSLSVSIEDRPLDYAVSPTSAVYVDAFNKLTCDPGQSKSRVIRIRNSGNAPLTINNIRFDDAPVTYSFWNTVTNALEIRAVVYDDATRNLFTLNGPLPGTVLVPGETVTATWGFAPTVGYVAPIGSRGGIYLGVLPTANDAALVYRTLRIDTNSAGPDPVPFVTPVMGYVPPLELRGTPLGATVIGNGRIINNGDSSPSLDDWTDFGSTPVDGGTVIRNFTTSTNLSNYVVVIEGQHAADFTRNGTSGLNVTFNPSDSGLRVATMRLNVMSGGDIVASYTFAIQGTGTVNVIPAPAIEVRGNNVAITAGDTTPSTLDATDFGSVAVGSANAADFTIRNAGDATLSLTGTPRVTISGDPAFSVSLQPLAATVPAGLTDTFRVRFAPTTLGSVTATVSITSNDALRPTFTFQVRGSTVAATQSVIHLADNLVSAQATAGTIILTALRDSGIDQARSVTWTTVAGTAVAGTDFTAASGTLAFAVGEVSKQISVTILAGARAGKALTVQLATTDAGVSLGSPASTLIQLAGSLTDNQAPIVDAGVDATVTSNATLAGTVTDDGLPSLPGLTVATWTTVSGPGTVTFANAGSPTTTVQFSTTGIYVLQLSATDGALTSTDTATITVTVNPPNAAPVIRVRANAPSGAVALP